MKYTARYVKRLVRAATQFPFCSAKQLAKQLYDSEMQSQMSRPPGAIFQIPRIPSREYVRRVLKKHGVLSFVAARRPLLTKRHVAARLKFARELWDQHWGMADHVCRVLFYSLLYVRLSFRMRRGSAYAAMEGCGAGEGGSKDTLPIVSKAQRNSRVGQSWSGWQLKVTGV